MRRLMEILGIASYQRYGGLTLGEWARQLHYRNEDKGVVVRASPMAALNAALQRHGRGAGPVTQAWEPKKLAKLGMQHRNRAVQLLAVAAIVASDFSEAEQTDALALYLNDPKLRELRSSVRLPVAGCLNRIGTMEALTAVLDGGPYCSGLERAVIWKIRESQEPGYAPVLARFIQRNKGYYKDIWGAVDGLADLGAAAIPEIRKLLWDENAQVRESGFEAIFRLKQVALPLVDDVRRLLQDKDPAIRCSAASELWDMNGSDEGLAVALALAAHASAEVRESVAWVLRHFRKNDASALKVLQQYAEDSDENVRNTARLILSK